MPLWVDDAVEWQENARKIEDRLSDALHDRLVERFVERRRTTAHVKTAAERASPFGRLHELRQAWFAREAPATDDVETAGARAGRWADAAIIAIYGTTDPLN